MNDLPTPKYVFNLRLYKAYEENVLSYAFRWLVNVGWQIRNQYRQWSGKND